MTDDIKTLRDIEVRRRHEVVGEAAHYLGYLLGGRLWEDEVAEFEDKFRIRASLLRTRPRYAGDADVETVLAIAAKREVSA